MCQKFGWTITELYEQPNDKVEKFLHIMQIQMQAESKKG